METKSPVTAVAPIPGTNFTVNVTATIQRSLWQTCFKFNGTQSCEAIQKISFENVDSEKTAERDGTFSSSFDTCAQRWGGVLLQTLVCCVRGR